MSKTNLLKKLQNVFQDSEDKNLEGFKAFDSGVAKLKAELREKIQVNTLDEVNDTLDKFKKKIDLTPLSDALEQIRTDLLISDRELRGGLEERLEELRGELSDARGMSKDSTTSLQEEITKLEIQLLEVASRKPLEFPDFLTPIKSSEDKIVKIVNNLEKFDDKELKKEIKDLEEVIKKLRIELVNRINERGGGNMNRSIFIGGANAVAKYTDINFKAGSNVTLTYVNNEQTKKVDITIASSGGGGGSVRSINSISVDTTAGGTAGTDYVYLVSGTTTLTLPTAVGNKNLYTVKNVGTGVVTIAFNGVETGDGNATITMATQFTSVDLISDTVNWNIT